MAKTPEDGIVDVATRMRYSLPDSHAAFQMSANLMRNRVMDLERELEKYKHAIEIMDACRLALHDAACNKAVGRVP